MECKKMTKYEKWRGDESNEKMKKWLSMREMTNGTWEQWEKWLSIESRVRRVVRKEIRVAEGKMT